MHHNYKALKKVLSIFFLSIFLFGNVGVTLATHYCDGKINEQTLMLVEEELDCNMDMGMDCEMEGPTCPMHQKQKEDQTKQNLKTDNCCDNQFTELKVKDGFDTKKVDAQINIDFLFAFVASFTSINFNEHVSPVTYYDISPTLPPVDIIVRVQSFLI